MFKHVLLLAVLLNPLILTANITSARDIEEQKQPIMTRIAKGSIGIACLAAAAKCAQKTYENFVEKESDLFKAYATVTPLLAAAGLSTLAQSIKGIPLNLETHINALSKIGFGAAIIAFPISSILYKIDTKNCIDFLLRPTYYLNLPDILAKAGVTIAGSALMAHGICDINKIISN